MDLLDWKQVWLEKDPDWLIEGLIPEGKQVHLLGAAGVGKSLLAMDWALRIIEGSQVFGNLDTQQGTVLWLDYEMGTGFLKERLEAYGFSGMEAYDWLQERFHIAQFPSIPSLDTEEAMWEIMDTVNLHQPALVVVDSAGVAFQGDENSSETYRNLGRNLGRALRESGTAFLLLDNLGKDSTRGSRGSSRKKDEADLQWMMKGNTKGDYTLTLEKDRIGITQKQIPMRLKEDPQLHWVTTAPRMISDAAAKVINELKALGTDLGTITSKESIRSHGISSRNESLAEAVKWIKTHEQ